MNLVTRIDLGIATFRRPALLSKLLDSLAVLNVPTNHGLRVIVADNDAEQSAKEVIESRRSDFPFEILYLTVEARGISYARNSILDSIESDYIGFLDDDETVGPDWLKDMLGAIGTDNADVVFGPVKGILPEDAPVWARDHPSFRRPSKPSGTGVSFGATNNALFKSKIVVQDQMRFSSAYALTGGEDTEFFSRVHDQGYKMVWCADAKAEENIPIERLRIRWVLLRGFRGGQSYFRVFQANRPIHKQATFVLRAMVLSLTTIPIIPVLIPFSTPLAVRMTTRIFGWFGQISAFVFPSWNYQEYASQSYRPVQASDESR